MRRLASIVAVFGFFVMAGVGVANDVPLFECGIRSLAGAAVLFVMAMVAGRIVIGIMVEIIKTRPAGSLKDTNGDSRSQ